MKTTKSRNGTTQIWRLFKKLSPPEKIKLVRRLENDTREEAWDRLVEQLSRRFQKSPISEEEITEIVEQVRQERYARSQGRS